MQFTALNEKLHTIIQNGTVIPACPLALNSLRQFDLRRQTALMRYYCEAGAGGVAVAVHTTQFEIRRPDFNLLEPVLRTCAEAIDEYSVATGRPVVKIAGIVGKVLVNASIGKSGFVGRWGAHGPACPVSAAFCTCARIQPHRQLLLCNHLAQLAVSPPSFSLLFLDYLSLLKSLVEAEPEKLSPFLSAFSIDLLAS